MSPASRTQAAIEVLDRWQSGSQGLDRVLAAWGRANRYAGSGDRRAIADLVYDAVRRRRSAAWAVGAAEPPQRLEFTGSRPSHKGVVGGIMALRVAAGGGQRPN